MTPEHQPILLKRDCEAIAIPSGLMFHMEQGTEVVLMQSLGGTYTVTSRYGLARIDAKDADALGLEPPHATNEGVSFVAPPQITEQQIWDVLKTVYDPEIPVNIVDLGLVYHLEIQKLESGGNKIFVKMTLTAPGCGMGPVIQADAKMRILAVPGVNEAEVELVWDPPWNQEMISEEGRMQLGMI
ncbi:MAG: putative Fe-S cluster assembly protein SufT [bacterium]